MKVLLAKLFTLPAELSCSFESNLLQLVFFSLLSFHADLKNLAIILIQRLVGQSTIEWTRFNYEIFKETKTYLYLRRICLGRTGRMEW